MKPKLYSISGSSPDISLLLKVEAHQRVVREWRPYLSDPEYIVLIEIVDRTIGWGRREAYFTIRALVQGDEIYSGCGVGRSTVFRALGELERKGFISRRKDQQVPDRVHYAVRVDWKPEGLEPLKGRSNQSRAETTPSRREIDGSRSGTLYTVSPSLSENGSLAPADADAVVISSTTARVRQKKALVPSPAARVRQQVSDAQAVPEARLAEIGQTTSTVIEAAWRLALSEVFPGNAERAWGAREKGQAKVAMKNWLGAKTIPFPMFVEWSVRNWTAIMSKQFRWMTKSPPPDVPTWSFFIAMLAQFTQCHGEHKLEEWLTSADRTELERMQGRGMTYDQALTELASNKAAAGMRKEMERREINVTARGRAADAALDRATRLVDYGGAAPIHPRSRAADKLRRGAALSEPVGADPEMTGAGVPMVDPESNPFD